MNVWMKCFSAQRWWLVGALLAVPAAQAGAAPLSPSTIAESSGQYRHGASVVIRGTGTTRVSVMSTCGNAWCPRQEHRVVRDVPPIKTYKGSRSDTVMHHNQAGGATVAGGPIVLYPPTTRRYEGESDLFSGWDWYGALTGRQAEGVPSADRVSGLPDKRPAPRNPVNMGQYRNKMDHAVDDLTTTDWIEEAANIDIRKADQNADGILSGLTRFSKGIWSDYIRPFFGKARERIPVIDDAANKVEGSR